MHALYWTVVCGAVATGCVVSFEDYPVADPDASAAGGSSGVGASGGAWADASTGASGGVSGVGASGGSGASGGASGSGGAAGSGASGGASGSGGAAGSGGVGGAGGAGGVGAVAGIGGVGGDACVPEICDGLQCGIVDDKCGGTVDCKCSGPAGCDNGTCTSVVATYCGNCQGAFTEPHPAQIQAPLCGTCGTASTLRVCALPGWAMKIAVTTNSACPVGYHLAVGMGTNPDCDGDNRQICIQD